MFPKYPIITKSEKKVEWIKRIDTLLIRNFFSIFSENINIKRTKLINFQFYVYTLVKKKCICFVPFTTKSWKLFRKRILEYQIIGGSATSKFSILNKSRTKYEKNFLKMYQVILHEKNNNLVIYICSIWFILLTSFIRKSLKA